MKMICPNCGSWRVTSVVNYITNVHNGKCSACGYTWIEHADWQATNPCPSCGRELDGVFQCRQCDEGVKEPLIKEAERQERATKLLSRDNSFLTFKMIGGNTYAAVVPIIFGGRIIVGHVDDVYGYELGWDYTGNNTFTSLAAAVTAFHAWSGSGEPQGYTRALPGNDRSQTTDPVLKEWPL